MDFDKGTIIKFEGRIFECLIADDEYAVFCKHFNSEDLTGMHLSSNIIIKQAERLQYDYDESYGICNKCGKYVFADEPYTVFAEEYEDGRIYDIIVHSNCR